MVPACSTRPTNGTLPASTPTPSSPNASTRPSAWPPKTAEKRTGPNPPRTEQEDTHSVERTTSGFARGTLVQPCSVALQAPSGEQLQRVVDMVEEEGCPPETADNVMLIKQSIKVDEILRTAC
jgi:hypothetical protein